MYFGRMKSILVKSEFLAWFLVWGGGLLILVGLAGMVFLFDKPLTWLPILLFGFFAEYQGVMSVREIRKVGDGLGPRVDEP